MQDVWCRPQLGAVGVSTALGPVPWGQALTYEAKFKIQEAWQLYKSGKVTGIRVLATLIHVSVLQKDFKRSYDTI